MNMTQREATELAERIIKTWPSGPRQGIWFDVLSECERGTAAAAYVHLRDTVDRAPSIAAFRAQYRAQRPPRDTTTAAVCSTCDGTGLRSARQPIGTTTYDVVVACGDCPAGIAAARTLRRIDEANAADVGHTRRHDVGPVQLKPSNRTEEP